ncbi:hypothetical protein [Arsenophonus endosymbiont of Aphis craccivora]|uniref:hypothetical protein n=1 Tax=Arsenophonus endosymbiont of Aphis craccivora TaxID=1231049 RepID=UPI0015DE9453|nr:hypothetical protein [Arsenophonus endosymbiont of Aphis craccivora]
MPWGPDVETNLAISSANHLKVRFIQQSHGSNKVSTLVASPNSHLSGCSWLLLISTILHSIY